MSDHFAAFSFVDRITHFESGKRATAVFAVPPGIASFPSCLVAEAVAVLVGVRGIAHLGVGRRHRRVDVVAVERVVDVSGGRIT